MKVNEYFELLDESISPCWLLGEIADLAGTMPDFLASRPIAVPTTPLVVALDRDGPALDYCTTGFAVPVARRALAYAMAAVAGSSFQSLPVRVRDHDDFVALNTLRSVFCLDEDACDWAKWSADDGRPDLRGTYRSVVRLRIRKDVVTPNDHIFRVGGWEPALIVSSSTRRAMESSGCVGARFVEVLGSPRVLELERRREQG